MTTPLKANILEQANIIIHGIDAISEKLKADERTAFAESVRRFAEALNTDDPDAQLDAWYEARREFQQFEAYRIVEGDPRKFFDDDIDETPQTADEVTPRLLECAKKISEEPDDDEADDQSANSSELNQ